METLEQIQQRVASGVPGAQVEIMPNPSRPEQSSLLVDCAHAAAVARFLKQDPQLCLDYLSNVSGVDWPDTVLKEKTKSKRLISGVEKEIETVVERVKPGYLEVVYHLYSTRLQHGPVILRQRTSGRTGQPTVTSLTPVWRGAELQEREVYDLFGVRFEGHPDLRRILMWEGFQDFPMRKDYVQPDDYEWEPTPHEAALEKARKHYPNPAGDQQV